VELEAELKAAKVRERKEQFLEWMESLDAKSTGYNCKFCGGEIYRTAERTACCLCTMGASWWERKCYICGEVVEVQVSNRWWDGHRGHTDVMGTFKVKEYTDTTPNSYMEMDKIRICKDCMKLQDLEHQKNIKDQTAIVNKTASKIRYLRAEVRGAKKKLAEAEQNLKNQLSLVQEEGNKLRALLTGGR